MKTVSTVGQTEIPDLFVPKEHKPALDLKGSVFTLTVLRLHSNELPDIEAELKAKIAQGPRFFEDAPVVVDVEPLKEQSLDIEFATLVKLMRDLRLVPVGVRHASHSQQELAKSAGLALMKGGAIRDLPSQKPAAPEPEAKAEEAKATRQHKVEKPTDTDAPVAASPTKVIYQPIRSGQQIYARGGDLIVLAAVNAGAEIVADGNIHVYAPLRGRALAGVGGDQTARIFCQNMGAELVSVAGHYRVFEDNVPDAVRHKAVQIFLDENEQLKIEPMGG